MTSVNHPCPLCKEDQPGETQPADISYTDYHGVYVPVFSEEWALAYLFAKDLIFISGLSYNKDSKLFELCVNCGDTFAWATADAESFTPLELPELYNAVWKDPVWGSTVWVIKKRKLRPMAEIIKKLKDHNLWDEEMESYPLPSWK